MSSRIGAEAGTDANWSVYEWGLSSRICLVRSRFERVVTV
jgi:hypothetical protein